MHNKAIRCRTGSTQKVLNTDGVITPGKQTRGHAAKGVLKINDLKNISQLMSATTDCSSRSRPTLPSSTDGMLAVSERPVTSASYDCAMALSLCCVTTDVFERHMQTLYLNGCLIGLS